MGGDSFLNLITIDGPAGAGKSTVCKKLASLLGWNYVTTGAIYRAFALLWLEKKRYLGNPKFIFKPLRRHNLISKLVYYINEKYLQDPISGKVYLGGRDISNDIKSPIVSRIASIFAENKNIRQDFLSLQRKVVFDSGKGAIVDGRDMGTIVFPEAPLKIFLTASSEERARRRQGELEKIGQFVDFLDLLQGIGERDARDTQRSVAPLDRKSVV